MDNLRKVAASKLTIKKGKIREHEVAALEQMSASKKTMGKFVDLAISWMKNCGQR